MNVALTTFAFGKVCYLTPPCYLLPAVFFTCYAKVFLIPYAGEVTGTVAADEAADSVGGVAEPPILSIVQRVGS